MKVNRYLCEIYTDKTYPIGTYAPFRQCGDNKRPDTIMYFKKQQHGFLIETDENHHDGYDQDCEWSKLMNHAQSLFQTFDVQKVTVIRFNPDVWKVDGEKVKVDLKDRLAKLKQLIDTCITSQNIIFKMFFMFYPATAPTQGSNIDDLAVHEVKGNRIEDVFSRLTGK